MASKEAKTVTFEPLDGFQQLRGHFGVVFNRDSDLTTTNVCPLVSQQIVKSS